MTPAAGGRAAPPVLVVFVLLLVATIGAFALTRALRATDDVVNAVEVDGRAGGGKSAQIRFTLVDSDDDAGVLVIDRDQLTVRTLLEGEPLAAGRHELSWDGRDDVGGAVDPGRYGLRVILGEQDRDILPPARITVPKVGGG